MFNKQELIDRLIVEEGLRLKPYKDTVDKWTIGIGRNLTDNGISKEEAFYLCNNDIDNAIRDLQSRVYGFNTLPDKVQFVLADMCFNLGINGLLKFKNTLTLIRSGYYEIAAEEMLKSLWASQVGQRARDLSEILKSVKDE